MERNPKGRESREIFILGVVVAFTKGITALEPAAAKLLRSASGLPLPPMRGIDVNSVAGRSVPPLSPLPRTGEVHHV
jgi:hypothetical protein